MPLPNVQLIFPGGKIADGNVMDMNDDISKVIGRTVRLTKVKPKEISLERLDPLVEEETILDMLEILNYLNINETSLGGFSLGGYMSLAFYRKYPDRVSSLLIIDTGPGFKNDKAREGWNKYAIKSAEKYENRDRKGIGNAARGMLTQKDDRIINSLPNISAPTLIVVGEDDKPFLSAAEYMHNKILNSKKIIIPKAGHAVNIDQPKLFNSAVLDFLKR
jgi:pimeloyl-ACP methyl ester carboxylesterase